MVMNTFHARACVFECALKSGVCKSVCVCAGVCRCVCVYILHDDVRTTFMSSSVRGKTRFKLKEK